MVWQDAVLLGLNLIFGLLLVPQIKELRDKKTAMNPISCTATLIALGILAATYATLNLWLAVVGDAIDVAAWGLLLGFSIKNKAYMPLEPI